MLKAAVALFVCKPTTNKAPTKIAATCDVGLAILKLEYKMASTFKILQISFVIRL